MARAKQKAAAGKKGHAVAQVSDLDLAVRGVGLGEPFDVHLTAAVQSREKNLDLDSGVAARVENLAGADGLDGGHF